MNVRNLRISDKMKIFEFCSRKIGFVYTLDRIVERGETETDTQ